MKMGKRKTMDDESPKSHGRVTARKEKASKMSKRSRTPKNDKGAKSTSKGHREVEVDNTHCLFCKKCFSSPEDDKPNDETGCDVPAATTGPMRHALRHGG